MVNQPPLLPRSCNPDLSTHYNPKYGSLHFLVEITLDGGGYWACFRQSSADLPGLMIFGIFMIIVILMLLNTLIAMMADTFSAVTHDSFPNYAAAFAKVLVFQRCKTAPPVPLNLLSLPFLVGEGVWKLCRVTVGRRQRRPSIRRKSTLLPHGISSVGSDIANRVANDLTKWATPVADSRDAAVVSRIDTIRMMLLQDPQKKLHFERAIARFCRVQEDDAAEPVSADDVREILRENMEEVVASVAALHERLEAYLPPPQPNVGGTSASMDVGVSISRATTSASPASRPFTPAAVRLSDWPDLANVSPG